MTKPYGGRFEKWAIAEVPDWMYRGAERILQDYPNALRPAQHLCGRLYNDPRKRWSEGRIITTSLIISIDRENGNTASTICNWSASASI